MLSLAGAADVCPRAFRGLASEGGVEIIANLLLLMEGSGPTVGVYRRVSIAACRRSRVLAGPVGRSPAVGVAVQTSGVLQLRLAKAGPVR